MFPSSIVSIGIRKKEGSKFQRGKQNGSSLFFTLAEDTQENRTTLVAACQEYLSGHDGTVYFSAGIINEELDRDVNDKEFDVALHVVFASRKYHDAYQTNPRHLNFVKKFSHLWSTVRVFDSNVPAPTRDKIPEAGQGFAGMLTGKVAKKDNGDPVTIVVTVDPTTMSTQIDD